MAKFKQTRKIPNNSAKDAEHLDVRMLPGGMQTKLV